MTTRTQYIDKIKLWLGTDTKALSKLSLREAKVLSEEIEARITRERNAHT